MENSEFSTEFDVLYNNITSNKAPGLNEYEKSVFLTNAQLQLVNEYFNLRTDGVGGGFDGSQKRQYDFSSIIKTHKCDPYTNSDIIPMDRRGKLFSFPEDYFLVVNETLLDGKNQYSILPLSYKEYERLMLKPYNYPIKKGVWRLIVGTANNRSIVELIGKFGEEATYILRYVPKLSPIILDDLSNYGTGVTIDTLTEATPCKMPEETHREILERAVTLAKIAWQGSTLTQATAQQER